MYRLNLKKFSLVLASSSPRRRKLLSELHTPFKIISGSIPENRKRGEIPSRMVRRLAVQKAESIARRLRSKSSLVIGADTVVVFKGKIFGKPKSRRHAAEMLMKLSGKTHCVYTGVAVVNSITMESFSAVDVSKVQFRKITFPEALRIGQKHLDKSGSYACQDKRDNLVSKITGDWQTLVGLPIRILIKLLNRMAAH